MLLIPVAANSIRDLGSADLLIRVAIAVCVSVGFSLLARHVHGVTRSGAIAGAVLCFLLFVSAGVGAFVALIAVFGLASGTTRLGYSRKRTLGVAENSEGRDAFQVVANIGVATLAALAFTYFRSAAMATAACAALAEAAADTVSSELGQTSTAPPRLVTTWRTVSAGTNGGITVKGTLAGLLAALTIALVCMFASLVSLPSAVIVMTAGFLGMIFDSFLGATLERRELLGNNAVNFLSTLFAALLAVCLHKMFL